MGRYVESGGFEVRQRPCRAMMKDQGSCTRVLAMRLDYQGSVSTDDLAVPFPVVKLGSADIVKMQVLCDVPRHQGLRLA